MVKSADVLFEALKQISHNVDTKLPCFSGLLWIIQLLFEWLVLQSRSCHSSFSTDLPDFPDGLVVKTPHFHCRGHGLDPWLGN